MLKSLGYMQVAFPGKIVRGVDYTVTVDVKSLISYFFYVLHNLAKSASALRMSVLQ